MRLALIVAASSNHVIGAGNRLPWHLPADLQRFKRLTVGHRVIMGRKTYESIGKPLPDRTNIVISGQPGFAAPGCEVVSSLEEALAGCRDDEEVFVIGGAGVYQQAIDKAMKIYLTRIHREFEGDAVFPKLDPAVWREVSREDHAPDERNPYAYSFLIYSRAE